jgi:hypothetical protein
VTLRIERSGAFQVHGTNLILGRLDVSGSLEVLAEMARRGHFLCETRPSLSSPRGTRQLEWSFVCLAIRDDPVPLAQHLSPDEWVWVERHLKHFFDHVIQQGAIEHGPGHES